LGYRNVPLARERVSGPRRMFCGLETTYPAIAAPIIESVIVWSGEVGRGMIRDRHTAGNRTSSRARVGESRSCRMYQSVFASARHTTVTSWRTPATSWAHQSGKVSLSP
jgi:hypothetical protein